MVKISKATIKALISKMPTYIDPGILAVLIMIVVLTLIVISALRDERECREIRKRNAESTGIKSQGPQQPPRDADEDTFTLKAKQRRASARLKIKSELSTERPGRLQSLKARPHEKGPPCAYNEQPGGD